MARRSLSDQRHLLVELELDEAVVTDARQTLYTTRPAVHQSLRRTTLDTAPRTPSPYKLKQKVLNSRSRQPLEQYPTTAPEPSPLLLIADAIRENTAQRNRVLIEVQDELRRPRSGSAAPLLSSAVVKLLNRLRSLTLSTIEMIRYFHEQPLPRRSDADATLWALEYEFQETLVRLGTSDVDGLATCPSIARVFESLGSSAWRNPFLDGVALDAPELLLWSCQAASGSTSATSSSLCQLVVAHLEAFALQIRRHYPAWQLLPAPRVARALLDLLENENRTNATRLLPSYLRPESARGHYEPLYTEDLSIGSVDETPISETVAPQAWVEMPRRIDVPQRTSRADPVASRDRCPSVQTPTPATLSPRTEVQPPLIVAEPKPQPKPEVTLVEPRRLAKKTVRIHERAATLSSLGIAKAETKVPPSRHKQRVEDEALARATIVSALDKLTQCSPASLGLVGPAKAESFVRIPEPTVLSHELKDVLPTAHPSFPMAVKDEKRLPAVEAKEEKVVPVVPPNSTIVAKEEHVEKGERHPIETSLLNTVQQAPVESSIREELPQRVECSQQTDGEEQDPPSRFALDPPTSVAIQVDEPPRSVAIQVDEPQSVAIQVDEPQSVAVQVDTLLPIELLPPIVVEEVEESVVATPEEGKNEPVPPPLTLTEEEPAPQVSTDPPGTVADEVESDETVALPPISTDSPVALQTDELVQGEQSTLPASIGIEVVTEEEPTTHHEKEPISVVEVVEPIAVLNDATSPTPTPRSLVDTPDDTITTELSHILSLCRAVDIAANDLGDWLHGPAPRAEVVEPSTEPRFVLSTRYLERELKMLRRYFRRWAAAQAVRHERLHRLRLAGAARRLTRFGRRIVTNARERAWQRAEARRRRQQEREDAQRLHMALRIQACWRIHHRWTQFHWMHRCFYRYCFFTRLGIRRRRRQDAAIRLQQWWRRIRQRRMEREQGQSRRHAAARRLQAFVTEMTLRHQLAVAREATQRMHMMQNLRTVKARQDEAKRRQLEAKRLAELRMNMQMAVKEMETKWTEAEADKVRLRQEQAQQEKEVHRALAQAMIDRFIERAVLRRRLQASLQANEAIAAAVKAVETVRQNLQRRHAMRLLQHRMQLWKQEKLQEASNDRMWRLQRTRQREQVASTKALTSQIRAGIARQSVFNYNATATTTVVETTYASRLAAKHDEAERLRRQAARERLAGFMQHHWFRRQLERTERLAAETQEQAQRTHSAQVVGDWLLRCVWRQRETRILAAVRRHAVDQTTFEKQRRVAAEREAATLRHVHQHTTQQHQQVITATQARLQAERERHEAERLALAMQLVLERQVLVAWILDTQQLVDRVTTMATAAALDGVRMTCRGLELLAKCHRIGTRARHRQVLTGWRLYVQRRQTMAAATANILWPHQANTSAETKTAIRLGELRRMASARTVQRGWRAACRRVRRREAKRQEDELIAKAKRHRELDKEAATTTLIRWLWYCHRVMKRWWRVETGVVFFFKGGHAWVKMNSGIRLKFDRPIAKTLLETAGPDVEQLLQELWADVAPHIMSSDRIQDINESELPRFRQAAQELKTPTQLLEEPTTHEYVPDCTPLDVATAATLRSEALVTSQIDDIPSASLVEEASSVTPLEAVATVLIATFQPEDVIDSTVEVTKAAALEMMPSTAAQEDIASEPPLDQEISSSATLQEPMSEVTLEGTTKLDETIPSAKVLDETTSVGEEVSSATQTLATLTLGHTSATHVDVAACVTLLEEAPCLVPHDEFPNSETNEEPSSATLGSTPHEAVTTLEEFTNTAILEVTMAMIEGITRVMTKHEERPSDTSTITTLENTPQIALQEALSVAVLVEPPVSTLALDNVSSVSGLEEVPSTTGLEEQTLSILAVEAMSPSVPVLENTIPDEPPSAPRLEAEPCVTTVDHLTMLEDEGTAASKSLTIWDVVETASLEDAQLLLLNGVDLYALEPVSQRTMLHLLAQSRAPLASRVALQRFLIDVVKLDVNAQDTEGNTPLMAFSIHGCVALVEAMLSSATDLWRTTNHDGRNAFHCACAHDQPEAAVRIQEVVLTKAGLPRLRELHAPDAHGATPLHTLAIHGHTECLRAAISSLNDTGHAALVEQVDRQGATPLHHAVAHGHVDFARELLRIGANVAARDAWQRRPLHLATRATDGVALVTLLAEHGTTDVNAVDARGDTALHWAAASGRALVVRQLLVLGADPHALNSDYETPGHVAVAHRHTECVRLLSGAPDGLDGSMVLTSVVHASAMSYYQPTVTRSHGINWDEVHEGVELVDESGHFSSDEEE